MSVSLWAYDPDRCDGDYCPMNCQFCQKNPENGWDDEEEKGDE